MIASMKDILAGKPKEIRSCDEHGEYESINYLGNVWGCCPVCAKIDAERRDAEEAEKRRLDEINYKQLVIERKLKSAGIPPRFVNKTFDNYIASTAEQEKALSICKIYADNFDSTLASGQCLLFCGNAGTGKTHLAAAIAMSAMFNDGASVLFITVMKVIRRIKSTWGSGSAETESDVIDAICSPDLLIIDEIGVQFGSVTEENFIFEIIDERYRNKLPTIIISNLDIQGVKKYLGDRSFDRLREGGGKHVPFIWGSYRGNK